MATESMRLSNQITKAGRQLGAACIVGLTLCVDSAAAHSGTTPGQIRFTSWSWPPFVISPLSILGAMYAVGAIRMWRRRSHAGLTWKPIACFAAGWSTLVLALDSPLHELGEQLFSVHMIQHEVLMLVSAPLLLLGRPAVVFVWALPTRWRKIGRLSSHRAVRRTWTVLSAPVVAWCLQAFALWSWHAPALFDSTLRSEAIHAAQHISFFATALLFWWPLTGEHFRSGDGAAIVYTFTTGVHMSLLGALLTFAPRPWYPAYAVTAPFWHLSALEDQQLGGLIMWIPAGTILFVATLFLLHRWMKHSDDRWAFCHPAPVISPASTGHED